MAKYYATVVLTVEADCLDNAYDQIEDMLGDAVVWDYSCEPKLVDEETDADD